MPRPLPIIGLVAAVVAFAADRLSKYVMVAQVMDPPDKVITVLPVFDLRLAWNPGISFSLFNSGETATVIALALVQLAVTAVLTWYLWRIETRWMQLAAGLIIGGAVGNILDRALFGAVADFLDFHWGEWHFPTFNIADSCISVGVFLWLLDAALRPSHHSTPATTSTPAPRPDKD